LSVGRARSPTNVLENATISLHAGHRFLLCGDRYELRRPRQTFPAMVSIFLCGNSNSWGRRLLRPCLALGCAGIQELLHERSQILCCLLTAERDDPTLEGLTVLVFLPIEEFIALGLGHFQNSASPALALPFLGPCVDRLSGDFRDGGGCRENRSCGRYVLNGVNRALLSGPRRGSPPHKSLLDDSGNSLFRVGGGSPLIRKPVFAGASTMVFSFHL
jgi:hypothetical protein